MPDAQFPNSDTVVIPDESGMGYDEVPIGTPHWDMDSHRYMVQLDQFRARPATEDEVAEYHRTAPSESGYGWTRDGSYPFFPGLPCVHCGRFVGRDGIFNVEHFEMSSEIASLDAEHRDCSIKAQEQWQATVARWDAERAASAASSTRRERRCETCEGEGVVHCEAQLGGVPSQQAPCPDCDGKGTLLRHASTEDRP